MIPVEMIQKEYQIHLSTDLIDINGDRFISTEQIYKLFKNNKLMHTIRQALIDRHFESNRQERIDPNYHDPKGKI